jgi:hypothetical protein
MNKKFEVTEQGVVTELRVDDSMCLNICLHVFNYFIAFDNHAEGSRQAIANYGNSVKSHGQFVDH